MLQLVLAVDQGASAPRCARCARGRAGGRRDRRRRLAPAAGALAWPPGQLDAERHAQEQIHQQLRGRVVGAALVLQLVLAVDQAQAPRPALDAHAGVPVASVIAGAAWRPQLVRWPGYRASSMPSATPRTDPPAAARPRRRRRPGAAAGPGRRPDAGAPPCARCARGRAGGQRDRRRRLAPAAGAQAWPPGQPDAERHTQEQIHQQLRGRVVGAALVLTVDRSLNGTPEKRIGRAGAGCSWSWPSTRRRRPALHSMRTWACRWPA